jgi:hypothetical protein
MRHKYGYIILILDKASVHIFTEAKSPSAIQYKAVNNIIKIDGKVYFKISLKLVIDTIVFLYLHHFFIGNKDLCKIF